MIVYLKGLIISRQSIDCLPRVRGVWYVGLRISDVAQPLLQHKTLQFDELYLWSILSQIYVQSIFKVLSLTNSKWLSCHFGIGKVFDSELAKHKETLLKLNNSLYSIYIYYHFLLIRAWLFLSFLGISHKLYICSNIPPMVVWLIWN